MTSTTCTYGCCSIPTGTFVGSCTCCSSSQCVSCGCGQCVLTSQPSAGYVATEACMNDTYYLYGITTDGSSTKVYYAFNFSYVIYVGEDSTDDLTSNVQTYLEWYFDVSLDSAAVSTTLPTGYTNSTPSSCVNPSTCLAVATATACYFWQTEIENGLYSAAFTPFQSTSTCTYVPCYPIQPCYSS